MKPFLLCRIALFILIAMFLQACASESVRTNVAENVAPTPEPTSGGTINVDEPAEPDAATTEERKRRDEVTEKFRVPSKGFEHVDFQNWTYPYPFRDGPRSHEIKLKGGKFEYDNDLEGAGWFDFDGAFYVNLTNDKKKDAVVLLTDVSCGGSCDGGSGLLYVLSPTGSKPLVLGEFETGSPGYGCGLRSLQIADRKITMEVFGVCTAQKHSLRLDGKSGGMSKFRFSDTTKLVFRFTDRFVLQSREVIHVAERSVKNYAPLISVE
ncbi:MAG: hypothetical protein ABI878_13485 [Acidobacteriota bacterium]